MTKGTLLVCGIGSGMARSLATIRDMGYSLVAITDHVLEDGLDLADRVIDAYPRDSLAVIQRVSDARLQGVVGVLSLGYENAPVVSQLSQMFGTPGLPVEVARDCTDKQRRIRRLGAAGIRVPRYRAANTLPDAMAALDEIGRPAVVKPVDLTSSIGVALLDSSAGRAETRRLVEQAITVSPSRRILVEEYLEGTEHTVEGVRQSGAVHVTGVSDRNYSQKLRFAPFFFENGDTLPSALTPEDLAAVVSACLKGVDCLHLDPAVFSCDVLRTSLGEVVLLEVAARMAGARFGTEIVPLSTGVNVLPSAVRMAVGEPLRADELATRPARPVVLRYLAPEGGLVTAVGDLPDPRSLSVYDLFWENRPEVGQVLQRLRSGKDVLAGVIASGGSQVEAESLALAALEAVPLTIHHDVRGAR